MNSFRYYSDLDRHPFTGERKVNFKAKVQNLYDYWADEEGGNQTDLYSKIIIPTLAVSGFFTQEQADVLVEEMQNV